MWAATAVVWCVTAGDPLAFTFTRLGDLPGGRVYSMAEAVSDDGTTVVGGSYSGGLTGAMDVPEAFVWTRAGGMRALGDLDQGLPGDEFDSWAYAVSADGSIIAGRSASVHSVADAGPYAYRHEGFRWTSASGMVAIGAYEPGCFFYSPVYGMSPEGGTLVGQTSTERIGWYPGFAWRLDAPSVIPITRELNESWGFGVDACLDGRIIIGRSWPIYIDHGHYTSIYMGPYMYENGVAEFIEWIPGEANAITPDGRVIAGGLKDIGAVRWTDGVRDVIAPSGAWGAASAKGVSADGRFAAGKYESGAFRWTEGEGAVDLGGLFRGDPDSGASGWTVFYATGISADGATVVGWGLNETGVREGWVAVFTSPCRADMNRDGAVGGADLAWFLGDFESGATRADFNGDGFVTGDDIDGFVAEFERGC